MPETTSVMLCGATGLVGRECLRLLSNDPVFGRLVVLTRRPLPAGVLEGVNTSQLEAEVIDFDRLAAHADLFRVNQIICALGTTIKQAGSKERFRQVDYGYPYTMARQGIEHGAEHFLLVSALGANARSRIFYNRVKGEIETAISALAYRSVTIARPSLLLGERAEFRLGEKVGKRLSFLLPRKYKPVSGRAVAAALLHAARENVPGTRIIESPEIRQVADAYLASTVA